MTKLISVMTCLMIFAAGISVTGCADISSSSNFGDNEYNGSWWKTGFTWPHDGNPLESDNCTIYSDAASGEARQTLAEYAEDALSEIDQLFEIENHDIFLYPPGQPQIDIYAYKLRYQPEWGGWSYYGGFLIYSLDHPERKEFGHTEPEIYIPTVTHEMTHVVQSLLIGGDHLGIVDIWLTEGLAEAMSGGTAGGRIADLDKLNELRQKYGWDLNPISMRLYDYPDVGGIVYYYYYPMFQLAVEYLTDPDGHGKSYKDIKDLFLDVSVGVPFQTAFKNRLGLTVRKFEMQFFNLMNDYLI